MSTKKGSRSSFAGRSNAGSNGKVGSSSPASSASATAATATSTTTTTTATTTNAWVRPLHSKPARPPPGLGGPPINEKPKVIDSNTSNLQIALRDRFVHLAMSMVGQKVVLTQTNGAVIEGLFGTFTPFAAQPPQTKNIYVIKACRLIKQPTALDAAPLTLKDGETIVIPAEKVSNVLVKSMRLDATGSNGISHAPGGTKSADMFQTDTEISAAKSAARSGDLIAAGSAWTSPVAVASAPSSNSRADALLGTSEDKGTRTAKPFATAAAGGLRGNIGEWDQFKANEELFNVSASFDENLYTTELDKSRIDAKKMAEAERIAREIEQMASSNMHVAEERGQAVQTDYDEEDRFSGVLPKDSAAKAGNVQRKEKQNEKAPPMPATNSRASALKGPTNTSTTNDVPKKTVPAPPKKMNYAAAVAAAAASQADAKKASASPPASSASSVVARVTPERPTQNDIATVTPDEKPSAQEKQLKESVEVTESTMDAPIDAAAESVVAEPSTESLSVEVIKAVEEGVVEEQHPVEQPLEVDMQDNVPAVELHQPLEDESASGSTTADESGGPKKVSSKLNANAKEFTFNPTAKTFTPGGAFPTSAPLPAAATTAAPDAHFVDPNTGMPMGHVAPHMHGVHYLPPGHMGQHGMMPMMNPQFAFRFQPPYPAMDQSMASMMQQQPQSMQLIQQSVGEQHSATPSSASESVEDEPMNQQRDAAPQQPTPHMPQQMPQQAQAPPQLMPNQQMPMQYHVPPGGVGYFSQGMTMGPRGPGMPHMGGYHPQFVSPQQMQVVPGAVPYRHMYPMQPGMPPNMQMRAPYYPNAGAPMHYPPNAFPGGGRMMDDGDYRGGRGARGPSGRGRRGGRRGGGGRGGGRAYYPPGSTGSGRQTPQTPTEMGDGMQELPDGTVVMHADMSALGPSDDQRELAD